MPTRVEKSSHMPEPHLVEKGLHDHDPHNKNWAHREALHLALGSILSPKRPHPPPSSRSTSGSLSPTHSASHTPGTRTPVHPVPFGTEYLHPHHHHAYHYRDNHPHTPSKLGQTSSTHSQENSPKNSNPSSPTMTNEPMTLPLSEPVTTRLPSQASPVVDVYVPPPSPGLGPIDDADPRLRPIRPTLTPLQPPDGTCGKTVSLPADLPTSGNGVDKKKRPVVVVGTPKAKFFETLQGKSAWDALIHGSFS